ncbi:MAG: hypothetical protein AAGF85_13610 [Bacteroidota bacterium]
MSKSSYNTNLVLMHKFNALPPRWRKHIPRGTLHNWKRRDINRIYGVNIPTEEIELISQLIRHKRLLKLAKGLYHLSKGLSELVFLINGYEKILAHHFPLFKRMINNASRYISVAMILKWLQVNPGKYYYYLRAKKCPGSTLQMCRNRYPRQLLPQEVVLLKSYLTNKQYTHWSTASICFQAMRDQKLFASVSTWYTYAKRFGIERARIKKKRSTTGIRANKPLEVIHMDITQYKPADLQKVFIYLIVDNYSRAILN